MKINDKEIIGEAFAYDECHKMYILEDQAQLDEAKEMGYSIEPIGDLEDTFRTSCSLRFISNWNLTKQYVEQFESATFKS